MKLLFICIQEMIMLPILKCLNGFPLTMSKLGLDVPTDGYVLTKTIYPISDSTRKDISTKFTVVESSRQ